MANQDLDKMGNKNIKPDMGDTSQVGKKDFGGSNLDVDVNKQASSNADMGQNIGGQKTSKTDVDLEDED